MLQFNSVIEQFGKKGEKTGWTYISISAEFAEKINPGNKKVFRVKGKIDDCSIAAIALMPMGDGSFIMPLNATVRKQIKKRKGDEVLVYLQIDNQKLQPPQEFIECLDDEPNAKIFYKQLSLAHQNYFCNWIKQAKTDNTKAKRIAYTINALVNGWHFGKMMQFLKANK